MKYWVTTTETTYKVSYALYRDGLRVLYGEVSTRPGWKRVLGEILAGLSELKGELEEGTGLRSRAFQQTSSTKEGLYTGLNVK